jgi:hypothetical protein
MASSIPEDPPCFTAKQAIKRITKKVQLEDLPSPDVVLAPFHEIQKVLKNAPVQSIFLCKCSNCMWSSIGKTSQERAEIYDQKMENDLQGDYAATYALLIHINAPGLISYFRAAQMVLRHAPFGEAKLKTLLDGLVRHQNITQERAADCFGDILEHQYRFFAPLWNVCTEFQYFSHREALPLVEEPLRPGNSGNFGRVRKCRIMRGYAGDTMKQVRKFCLEFGSTSAHEL